MAWSRFLLLMLFAICGMLIFPSHARAQTLHQKEEYRKAQQREQQLKAQQQQQLQQQLQQQKLQQQQLQQQKLQQQREQQLKQQQLRQQREQQLKAQQLLQQQKLQQEKIQQQKALQTQSQQQKQQQIKTSQPSKGVLTPATKGQAAPPSGSTPAVTRPQTPKSSATVQPKSTSPTAGTGVTAPSSPTAKTPQQLYYQQGSPQNPPGTGHIYNVDSEGPAPGGTGKAPATGSATTTPPPAPAPAGSKSATPQATPASTVKPPATTAEGYSRLQAAKEALDYYTNGNGRFVKDREAQIEKLKQEIGFLESYKQPGPATSPAAASPTKTTTSSPVSPPATTSPGTAAPPKITSGGGTTPKPTGYLNVYNDQGNKVGQKPYWGTGSATDPYRDYPDVNKPFGDGIWGSGTRQDPLTNIVTPPKDESHHIQGTGSASGAGGPAGAKSEVSGSANVTPSNSPPASSAAPPATTKAKKVEEQLRNLEKEFAEKVKQQEQAIDNFYSKTRDEKLRNLQSYKEGSRIIGEKMQRIEKEMERAESRGDQKEIKMLAEDLLNLVTQARIMDTAQKLINNQLETHEWIKNNQKQELKDLQGKFQQQRQQLLDEINKNPSSSDINKKLKDYSNEVASTKFTYSQYEPRGNQSPLLNPKTFNPAKEKSQKDQEKWLIDRQNQISKEYDNKKTEIENEPPEKGLLRGGASKLSKEQLVRLENLEIEKQRKKRQIDIIYRERQIKSGRLSQDELNALNNPDWQDKLEKYRQDMREGRVGGDRPTP